MIVGVKATFSTISTEATSSAYNQTDWNSLRTVAESFWDAQKARIATTNRLERGGIDKEDGLYQAVLWGADVQEKHLGKVLRDEYRRVVPENIRAWVEETPALGEPSMARLLGHMGHPRIAVPFHWEGNSKDERHLVPDEPFLRTAAQLRQYCGVGNPALKRHRGMDKDEAMKAGSPVLRMLLHVIGANCVKHEGPYRGLYDEYRLFVRDKVHSVECKQCGSPGKPAQPGTPWRLGHQHGAALRRIAQQIVTDLWGVARG
jgi:hypothetical protein